MSIKVFRDISELVTLQGAVTKQARYTKEKDLSILKNGAFISVNGVIRWVGLSSQLTSKLLQQFSHSKNIKEYSFQNQTLMPGFVESHTHLVFSGNRSDEFEMRNQGVSYQEIGKRGGGIKSTMRSVRKTTEKQLLDLSQKRVDAFVKQGVTTLEVKSGYALDKNNEIKMLKVARNLKGPDIISTYLGLHAVPPEFESSASYLEFVLNEVLPVIAKRKLADRVDMFIEKGYFSVEQGEVFFKKAQKLDFKLTLHTEQLTRSAGYELLLDGAHSVDHMIQLRADDIKRVADSDLTCVLLPGADFYLKTKYPKARNLIDAGARVAIATDYNPGSCPSQNLSFMGVLSRLEMKMSLPEVIVAYTLGAAHALCVQKSVGSLSINKKANFAVLEGSWRDLFYETGYHPVIQTWKNSKKLKFS